MDQQQTERLITALESIAASLNNMNKEGVEVFSQGLLTVSAVISAPDGLSISDMPDEHRVQVFNPQSYTTGDIKPFITEAH